MSQDNRYDIIIIGSGAGGGTLAYALAPTGKRILLLERGDYVPREKDNWSTRAVNLEGKYNTKEVWRDKDGKPLHPHTNYYVGGNTKFYGAALFRLRKEDFGEIKHHGGLSPAWPISYEDLESYYTKAEQLYQVHGERGVDPTEPPASEPYPFPPVSHEPRIQQLSDDFARAGLKPFHVPLGIMLDGTTSIDDVGIVSYSWTQATGTLVTLTGTNTAMATPYSCRRLNTDGATRMTNRPPAKPPADMTR